MTYRISLCIQKIAGLGGGAEKVLVDLANHFSNAGHQVEIVTYEDTGGDPFYPLSAAVSVRNIKSFDERRRSRAWRDHVKEKALEYHIDRLINRLGRIPLVSKYIWSRRYGRMIQRLTQHIDWHKPDVMIPFMPGIFPYLLAARLKARHRPAIIVSNHNVPSADFQSTKRWDLNWYDRHWRRKSLRYADAVVVLLDEYKSWFKSAEQSNIHVIGNAMFPMARRIEPDERSNIFISVARLTHTKNQEAAIRAFSLVSPSLPDWKLHIFGSGPLEARLSEIIAELGLQERVFLLGKSQQIPQELSRSKVMLLPSHHEGFPLVLGEAFAAGVPAIGYRHCSGVNRLIEDNVNGFLIDANDDPVQSFANGMLTLAADESIFQRMSDAAYDFIDNGKYSPEIVFYQWDNLIERSIR